MAIDDETVMLVPAAVYDALVEERTLYKLQCDKQKRLIETLRKEIAAIEGESENK